MKKNSKIITLNNKERWNKIVKSFPNWDVFYLAEYVEAFQYNGNGEPILFYYDDGTTRAMNVIMKRDIADFEIFNTKIQKGQYFDVTSPYGYGGFIIEGENVKEVNNAYEEYCKENGIICEFVRFHLLEHYENKYNGEVENIKHNIIRELNLSPEDMLMDFEHKVRKNLKKAKQNGLTIQIDTEGNSLDDFLNIYYQTMDRNDAKNDYYFTKEFFNILNTMKDNTVYFNVIYEGKVISTELVIYSENNCYSYLGGTLSEYFNLRPNDFLKYEIIKWAYAKNIKNFVLGGGYGSDDDGIFKYKKSFAPNGIVDFYVGKKVFNEKVYNKLIEMRKQEKNFDENSKFFPLYRS